MKNYRPWRWFLKLENALHAIHEAVVRAFGQTPTVVTYIGYGSETKIRVLARALYAGKKQHQNPAVGIRGWRSFLAVPFRHSKINIRIGELVFTGTTDEGGILDETFEVALEPGWQTIELGITKEEWHDALILVISEETTFGVISDIDDTIMVTSLTSPLLALWNTFLLEEQSRDAVSGMPVLYERLQHQYPDAPFIYVSTGAWNVFPTHQRFMARNMFPLGPMLLTDWGTSDERWFRSGQEHKRESLERIVEEFPRIRWLLIGDDGEHDPERYHELAGRYPDRVRAIAMRKLTNDAVLWDQHHEQQEPSADSSQVAQKNSEQSLLWVFGHDGSGIAEQLKQAGIL